MFPFKQLGINDPVQLQSQLFIQTSIQASPKTLRCHQ